MLPLFLARLFYISQPFFHNNLFLAFILSTIAAAAITNTAAGNIKTLGIFFNGLHHWLLLLYVCSSKLMFIIRMLCFVIALEHMHVRMHRAYIIPVSWIQWNSHSKWRSHSVLFVCLFHSVFSLFYLLVFNSLNATRTHTHAWYAIRCSAIKCDRIIIILANADVFRL